MLLGGGPDLEAEFELIPASVCIRTIGGITASVSSDLTSRQTTHQPPRPPNFKARQSTLRADGRATSSHRPRKTFDLDTRRPNPPGLPSIPSTRRTSLCRKPESESAFEKPCAEVKRSAGSFSRAFLIAASTLGGIDTRTLVGAGVGCVGVVQSGGNVLGDLQGILDT